MKERVVITGVGVAAPNGVGKEAFTAAIRAGQSGIRYFEALQELNFSCCVAGKPEVSEALKLEYFPPLMLRNFISSGILYGCMAGLDAWADAGLSRNEEAPDWDSGTIFGIGSSGVEKMREAAYRLDSGKVKRLGSTTVPQIMASGVSAYLGGLLGLGNQVTTNSSACTTGTESILLAYERVANGSAKRMLAGSTSDSGPYIWGGFDAMKVMNFRSNENPESASRPMSATAAGFVPGSGAGALVLETLRSAQDRGATIYAEVLGGAVNSGGQRQGGTMTAPNSEAVQRCIKDALRNADVQASEVDLINGHLTATAKDPDEIQNWAAALGRNGADFPYIHSLKAMIGHCISGAGSIESVAAVLGLHHNFVFPTINCEDPHPEILKVISSEKIIRQTREDIPVNIIAKAGFGFGDVNACVLLKKYQNE
ncbi:beta-ketoacyl-[acyl-carrier-protein] synthase family protein [Lewinella cohaerens]|uniref:beta-ketoacyl-[acyl-carrier-protein] synthase family protein n=1 Tax=Lewinella cohaerens TaxID=70995 RepID=UPI0003681A1B|nr:beta-ketoacyl-[acyl-carrier-protein] synthase family protein [Lewinella cohaerens]